MKTKLTKKPFISNLYAYGTVVLIFIVMTVMDATGNLSSTISGLLVPVSAYIIGALALNLTVGVLGELSLGHAGFMSIGAFSGAVAAKALKDSIDSELLIIVISVLIGAFFAAVSGLIVGVPVLRLNGDYLAIVTLAFGEIIKAIVTNLYIGKDSDGLKFGFLNNDLGLNKGGKMILKGPDGISGISKVATFTVAAVLIIITLAIIFNLVNSKTGRAVMAIRDNRIAALSLGINVTKYKLMTFVLSSALAGVAGALYALSQSTISANKFDFNTSILLLVFVVLGGLGNMTGTIIATLILYLLPETLLRQFSDYRMLIYAIVLIIMMILKNNKKCIEFFVNIKNSIFGRTRKKSVSNINGGANNGK